MKKPAHVGTVASLGSQLNVLVTELAAVGAYEGLESKDARALSKAVDKALLDGDALFARAKLRESEAIAIQVEGETGYADVHASAEELS